MNKYRSDSSGVLQAGWPSGVVSWKWEPGVTYCRVCGRALPFTVWRTDVCFDCKEHHAWMVAPAKQKGAPE